MLGPGNKNVKKTDMGCVLSSPLALSLIGDADIRQTVASVIVREELHEIMSLRCLAQRCDPEQTLTIPAGVTGRINAFRGMMRIDTGFQ